MKEIKRKTLTNVISSILLQLTTLASGFIIPKIILSNFGSETNGLIASLNQFLNYITILEGGVNGVIMANLYSPIAKNESAKINSIINTSQKFFKKISLILIIYSIAIAAIYPLISENSFSYNFIFSIALILSFKLFAQYCFSFSYQNLLKAAKRTYIINITQIVILIIDTISAVIIAKYFPSIHLLKLFSALIYLIQPIIYTKASKKIFKLTKTNQIDKKLTQERWNGLSINIAAFVHNNTDIVILTLFTNLSTVSVYGVYNLVLAGIRGLIQSISNGLSPSIGILYAKNDKNLNKRFNQFEFINFITTFFSFSMATLLITPFVMIYTSNITDADYFQPTFGIIILAAEFAYMIREPYVKMAYMAGKFKEQSRHAYIEAALNIIISLALVWKLGLIGIAVGTLIAMTYRTVFQISFLKNNILNRPFILFVKRFLAFFIPSLLVIILCFIYIPLTDFTVIKWVQHALIYALIFLITYSIISVMFFKDELRALLRYIIKAK